MHRVLEATQKALEAGLIQHGDVHHILVKHDDTCPAIHVGGEMRCTCEPDIEIISQREFQFRVDRGLL